MSDQQKPNLLRRVGGLGVIIGLIVAAIGLSAALSSYFYSPRADGALYYHHPFFPFHFGWLIGGIFLLFIIFGIARWFFWPWSGGGRYRDRSNSAETILKERYAKGEITKEQFEQMRRDIAEHKD